MAEEESAPRQSAAGGSDRWAYYRLCVVIFLATVALVLLVVFFDAITLVGLLFIAAAAIASLLRPLVRLFAKHTSLAGLLIGMGFWLAFIGMLTGLGFAMREPIRELVRQLPDIEDQLNTVLFTVGDRFGIDDPPTLRQIAEPVLEWLVGGIGENGQVLAAIADGIGVILITIALIVFGSVFLLAENTTRIADQVARMLPSHRRPDLYPALRDAETRLRWWLIGIVTSMSVVGVSAFVGFTIVGLEMALPLAIVAGLAEIVPILGPTFAFLIILLFAATQGTTEIVGVLIVWAIIQVLEPYVIVPTVMRKAVRIPPLITLFTVVLWARLLGPLGLLLAIPINMVIWTALEHFYLRQR